MKWTRKDYNILMTVLPNGNIRTHLDDFKKTSISEAQYINPKNIAPTVIAGGGSKILTEMTKNIVEITLVDRIVPYGSSGGTGYCEYANLKVKYEDGESVAVTISDYYTYSTTAFMDLYMKLPYLGNPREAFDMLVAAVPRLFESNYEDLSEEFQEPKEGATAKGKRKIYRIRKLTSRECFRLMGCRDDEIDAMQSAGISESQCYKLAGNSIVVDTLLHGIYINLFLKDGIPEGQLF